MKDIKILLGKRIKELRKKLNISQQELAEKINVDARNLSNIECGISFPSNVTVPSSLVYTPEMILTNVDLPQPFSPARHITLPGLTLKFT